MCYNCWSELGKPATRTPQIERVADLVDDLHEIPDGCNGGNLHIITDDWNLETQHVQWCLDNVIRIQGGGAGEYDYTDPEQLKIEREIVDLMLLMTEAERGAALGLAAGFEG